MNPPLSVSTADLEASLREELATWEAAGRRRTLRPPAGLDFTSNDYLSLSRHPAVIEAAHDGLRRWGVGAPASRLLRGDLPPHRAAEEALAQWIGSEASLLFPSGWQANQAVLTTLAGPEDVLFSDRLNHASLIDGCRLARTTVEVFEHNDALDLEQRLQKARDARRRLIVVESVYSMEGDHAPLQRYEALAREYDAWLIIDEAHALGIFGPSGSGGSQAAGIGERVAARIATGGKALGVCGGFVAGSRTLVELLLHRGRSFVFTTAIPPATASALVASIALARRGEERRKSLLENARRLRSALAEAKLTVGGEGPIVPILLGSEEMALRVAERVTESGFDVRAVRPPTVPPGTCRLRIVCHADHPPEAIDRLASAVVAACTGHAGPPVDRKVAQQEPRARVIIGTDTGVGKTVVSALLVRDALRRGHLIRYLKPIQTGADCDTSTVRNLAGVGPEVAPAPLLHLELPASVDQAARHAGTQVETSHIAEGTRDRMGSAPEAGWILECAGGLLVPFGENQDQADLLTALDLPVILVARSGLGTLNHTLLTVEAMRRRGLALQALFLVGEPHPENHRSLRDRLPELPFFQLPPLGSLDSDSLDRWLAQHDVENCLP